MTIYDNIEQGTPEWRKLRAGKLTASNAQAIGNVGKGLETLVYATLAEKYSSNVEEGFSNFHTERGHELECIAISLYSLSRQVDVRRVAFVEMDEYSGCSPDGLVGDSGGLEVKSHDDAKHFRIIANGINEVDSKYIWQVQMNLLVTGRKWWDLLCYNPNFKENLVVFRIEPDAEKQEKLKEGLAKGAEMLKELEKKVIGRV